MKTRVHVLISGQVQGVWYRTSTKEQADDLGLTGWVRNTTDGDVEAVFEGEERSVDEMIAWCHQGPQFAQVTDVKVKREPSTDELKGFVILRDKK